MIFSLASSWHEQGSMKDQTTRLPVIINTSLQTSLSEFPTTVTLQFLHLFLDSWLFKNAVSIAEII